MPKMTPHDLLSFAKKQFEFQNPVLSLWQTLADNFYPERADFTITRNLGEEFADGIMNSYPVMMRRDLGNSFSAMLRDGPEWFKIGINGDPDHAGQAWLDWSSKRLYRVMYDRVANFVRATKEGDHDYATFGNTVISIEANRRYTGLLFRAWHLRDCAWWDDENGHVAGVARDWKPRLMDVMAYFKEDQLHQNMKDSYDKDKLGEAKIYHIHMPAEQYGEDTHYKYASIYLDVANEHIIEEVFTNRKHYVVPRFQTISGSPYAYSPASIVALPDARMLQAMTHTLLEAGERYARPPLVGTAQAVQGAINLRGDGITWVDQEYDERMGQALRPLYQDKGGFPIGLELRDSVVDVLGSAFYINKLTLPDIGHDMTAYEVQERMKQYRRENLPLFAPIEAEYNGEVCEVAFDLAMEMGLLGSPQDIPASLQGKDTVFKFQSPLSQSEEEEKLHRFNQVSQALAQAVELDDSVRHNLDFDTAFRDAVTGIGAPQNWLYPVEMVLESKAKETELRMAQAQLVGDEAA